MWDYTFNIQICARLWDLDSHPTDNIRYPAREYLGDESGLTSCGVPSLSGFDSGEYIDLWCPRLESNQ